MLKYVALWLLSVTISAFAQVLLKKSANKTYSSRIREYLNLTVIVSYGIFFISTILTMLALKKVPYAFSPMIEGVSYILIPLFGVLMLKERIPKRRWIGFGVILLGCVIYTSGLIDSGAMKEKTAAEPETESELAVASEAVGAERCSFSDLFC
ncbi:MAG: EamA family transporter [Lachnospiraceae bacterium]|nr:EamA family transporter [Lachnospiraceae bacterium]